MTCQFSFIQFSKPGFCKKFITEKWIWKKHKKLAGNFNLQSPPFGLDSEIYPKKGQKIKAKPLEKLGVLANSGWEIFNNLCAKIPLLSSCKQFNLIYRYYIVELKATYKWDKE